MIHGYLAFAYDRYNHSGMRVNNCLGFAKKLDDARHMLAKEVEHTANLCGHIAEVSDDGLRIVLHATIEIVWTPVEDEDVEDE